MLNQWLFNFAQWLDSFELSTRLHESYYMYNWVESTHVVALMLGLTLTNVPASRIASRLNVPMMVGFTIMIVTGLLLFFAVPVRTTQSIWFRIKLVLLFAAAVNAWLFHKKMNESVSSWDTEPKAPKRLRYAAGLSLGLWAGVVTTGRLIAYDWYDCYRSQSDLIAWAAGCMAE